MEVERVGHGHDAALDFRLATVGLVDNRVEIYCAAVVVPFREDVRVAHERMVVAQVVDVESVGVESRRFAQCGDGVEVAGGNSAEHCRLYVERFKYIVEVDVAESHSNRVVLFSADYAIDSNILPLAAYSQIVDRDKFAADVDCRGVDCPDGVVHHQPRGVDSDECVEGIVVGIAAEGRAEVNIAEESAFAGHVPGEFGVDMVGGGISVELQRHLAFLGEILRGDIDCRTAAEGIGVGFHAEDGIFEQFAFLLQVRRIDSQRHVAVGEVEFAGALHRVDDAQRQIDCIAQRVGGFQSEPDVGMAVVVGIHRMSRGSNERGQHVGGHAAASGYNLFRREVAGY